MSQMIAMSQVRPFVRVVNAKIAKDLGIKIPQSILVRADRVIQ